MKNTHYIDNISWPITGPDGGVIVEIVSQMVRHKIFARGSKINRVPPLKLCFQSVKYGLRQARGGRERSISEVYVVPDVRHHVFWPDNTTKSTIQYQSAVTAQLMCRQSLRGRWCGEAKERHMRSNVFHSRCLIKTMQNKNMVYTIIRYNHHQNINRLLLNSYLFVLCIPNYLMFYCGMSVLLIKNEWMNNPLLRFINKYTLKIAWDHDSKATARPCTDSSMLRLVCFCRPLPVILTNRRCFCSIPRHHAPTFHQSCCRPDNVKKNKHPNKNQTYLDQYSIVGLKAYNSG